jgi:hypothetical protein
MLIFNVGRGAEERVDPKYGVDQCPKWLVDALRQVTSLSAPPFNGPLTLPTRDGSTVVLTDFHRMGWQPKVKELCRAFEKEIRAMPSTQDREIWIRTHDIAIRLATVHAFYRCSEIVEVLDWEWAAALAKASTRELKQGVDKYMSEELRDAEAIDYLREYGRANRHRYLTLGELRKYLERKTGLRNIMPIIYHVLGTGDLVEIAPNEAKTDPRGQPTTYFKWSGRR